jgi:hypothetical protein
MAISPHNAMVQTLLSLLRSFKSIRHAPETAIIARQPLAASHAQQIPQIFLNPRQ